MISSAFGSICECSPDVAAAAVWLNLDDTWSHLDSMIGFAVLCDSNERVEGLVDWRRRVDPARSTRDREAGPRLQALNMTR